MRKIKLPMTYQAWEKVGLPIEGRSLMSSLTLIEADILEMVETKEKVFLGDVLEVLDWPDPIALMAVGGLIREKLVVANRDQQHIVLTRPPQDSIARF